MEASHFLVIGQPSAADPVEREAMRLLLDLPGAPERPLSEDGAAASRSRPDSAPAMVVLFGRLAHPVALARRLHTVWPHTHFLFAFAADQADAAQRAIGSAPMLGRHWSVAAIEGAALLPAASQALDAARRRLRLRMTLTNANSYLASQPVSGGEFQRLIASDHHLSNFLRHSNDAVLGLDAADRVLFWSQGAERLLGIKTADVLGRPVRSLEIWSPAMQSGLAQARLGGQPVTVEQVAELAGQTRAFEVVMSHPAERSATLGCSVVIHDVTLQRLAREQLQSSNEHLQETVAARTSELEKSQLALMQAQKLEALGKLTGGVAHDFNNVLQIIGSNLQLLEAALRSGKPPERLIKAATSAVDRGAKLSSQLLAFARKQPLNPLPIGINRRVSEMDELLRRALGEDIEIETSLAGGLWTTLVDSYQLENVLLNLAINARDAMTPGGRLTIETSNATLDDAYTALLSDVSPGQYVLVAVTDNGTGMSAEVLAQVFEPFFTTKPEGQGTGLGLSMAYGFAKQSGGHLRIYSEPGLGTTVKLYLPRSHDPEMVAPATLAGPIQGGTETILVVEDDLSVQTAAVSMLSTLGYRVLRANEAQSALVILQSGVHVDLLFTDVVMPGPLRSPDLARRAAVLLPGIAVLFTSGYTQNAIVHGGRLDPGVELLSKPYRYEDLARKVRHLLANRSQRSVQASAGHAADKVVNVPGAARTRILFVEDQREAREATAEMLDLLQYDVVSAEDAESAWALLQAGRFDILLTDITLPGESGTRLAQRAVRRFPELRVIFASGYGATAAIDDAMKSWHLPKPYGLAELEKVLAEVNLEGSHRAGSGVRANGLTATSK